MLLLVYSLMCNALIVTGPLFHNTANLHKNIVFLVRQLALLDLVATLIMVPIGLVFVLELEWAFGEFMCEVVFITFYTYHLTSCCLIAVLSSATFLTVRFGDETRARCNYGVIIAVWLTSFLVTLAPFLEDTLTYTTNSWSSKCGLIDNPDLEGFNYKVCLLMLFFSNFCIIITITPCISTWINNKSLGLETKREVKIVSLLSLFHSTFLVPVLIGRVLGGTSSQLLLLLPQHLLVSYKFFLFYWTLPRFRQYVRSVFDFPVCTSLCSDRWSLGSCWESFLNTCVRETDSRENLIVSQGDGRSER